MSATLYDGPVVTRTVLMLESEWCVCDVNQRGEPVEIISRFGNNEEAARNALADYFATKRAQDAPLAEPVEQAASFLTEIDGHLLLTGMATNVTSMSDYPVREMAAEYEKAAGNEALMHMTGKFVEADAPNVNGAYWTGDDLDYGERTPVHAPVNFLHRHRHIIGTFTDSKLIKPQAREAAANGGSQRHFLGVNAVVWKEFFPYESRMIEIASGARNLFWSMECQSRTVRCETSADGHWQGCGAEYPFRQVYFNPASVCAHLRGRSSQRHFVQPRFNAGAVILPPVKPGWKGATAEVREAAEKLAEHHYAEAAAANDDMDDGRVVALMAEIVAFGKSLQPA